MFNSVLRVALLDCPALVFDLNRGGVTRPFLPCVIIQFLPEVSLTLSLDDGTYLIERLLIVVVFCNLFLAF